MRQGTGLMALVLLVTLAATVAAPTVHGIEAPDSFPLEGRALTLNGAGAHKSFLFTVYVVALYLEAPSADAASVVGEDRYKALTLRFARDRDRADMARMFQDGFFNNAQEQLPQLQERLDRLLELFPDGVEEGETVTFTYRPNGGTRAAAGGREAVIEGADFMAALWSVWLGDVPADHDLKRALMGRE